ncbi:MAG: orotate phosphoribosyltransferase [Chthoniobacterales bacterium]
MKDPTAREELLEILKTKSICRGTFTLASGAESDFYVDAKVTTKDPKGMLLVGKVGWDLIKRVASERNIAIDSIGGLTMGADPIADGIGIVAQLENPANTLQTFAVRKEAKAHGRHKLIEGDFCRGDSVVVLDDVVTTGGSTLQAIDAIENEGGQIAFVVVLVDREQGGRQNIEARGYSVHPIFSRSDLVAVDEPRRAATAVA